MQDDDQTADPIDISLNQLELSEVSIVCLLQFASLLLLTTLCPKLHGFC